MTEIQSQMAKYSHKTILNELIQNADDAGATEVHAVWDKRQLNRHRDYSAHGAGLPTPGLHECQGPALVMFMDSVFTDQDFDSIQSIGGSGKVSNPEKTGRYGVGFNSVYVSTNCRLTQVTVGSRIRFVDST